MYIIYKMTNLLNGDSYVGFTSRGLVRRISQHFSDSKNRPKSHFHYALRKYGRNEFDCMILEEGSDPELGKNVREPYWISVIKPKYNKTIGGDGTLGFKHSESTRAKIGAKVKEVKARTGKYHWHQTPKAPLNGGRPKKCGKCKSMFL